MKDLLDVQVEMYPTILRGIASGEKIASDADEQEKIAATLLVAEALEEQKEPQEKKALVEAGLGAALGALAAGPLKKAIQKLHGEPEVPEAAGELLKSFRKILESQEAAAKARRGAVLAGLGGEVLGAGAVKALEHKEEKAAEDKSAEKEVPVSQDAKNARAVLDRLMKSFE